MATADINQEVERHRDLLAQIDALSGAVKNEFARGPMNSNTTVDIGRWFLAIYNDIEFSLKNLQEWAGNEQLSHITRKLRDY